MKTPSNNCPTLIVIELESDAQNPPHGTSLPLFNDDVLHVCLLSTVRLAMANLSRPSPCMSVPFWQNFNEELGMSYDTLNNGYAANMAGLATGCIIFIPIALRIGRRPVYLFTSLIMFAAGAWQAETYTVGDMTGMNAIAGIAGAVNEALFQVTVSFHLAGVTRYRILTDMTGNGTFLRASTWHNEWHLLYDGPSRGEQS